MRAGIAVSPPVNGRIIQMFAPVVPSITVATTSGSQAIQARQASRVTPARRSAFHDDKLVPISRPISRMRLRCSRVTARVKRMRERSSANTWKGKRGQSYGKERDSLARVTPSVLSDMKRKKPILYVCRGENGRTGFEIFKRESMIIKLRNIAEVLLVERPRK